MTRSLRIAIFSDSALPILNGVSVSIAALIANLRDQGHSVHLFTAARRGHRDDDPNTHRFPAIETPWTRGYSLAIPPFYPMLREFRKHEFDLIHTHTPYTIGFVGLRWAQSHDLPVVATYHTLYDKYVHYIPFFPKRYTRFKIAKHTNFYYNQVDQVIVPSVAAMKWLRRHSVHTPIHVIPTGIGFNPLVDRAEVRQRLGVGPDQPVLLYVGRIAREKNLLLLLEAAARVFRHVPNARLWLVGDGPFRAECSRRASEMAIGDRVRFFGFVPRDQVDEYYAAADVFVFSSVTETQGLVVSEAMAHGLPSVVVQGGGAGEAVMDGVNGCLVRNDPTAFAEAVLTILREPDLHSRLSHNARKSVRDHSPLRSALQVIEVYRAALQAREAAKEPVFVSA